MIPMAGEKVSLLHGAMEAMQERYSAVMGESAVLPAGLFVEANAQLQTYISVKHG